LRMIQAEERLSQALKDSGDIGRRDEPPRQERLCADRGHGPVERAQRCE
jgi:hypothetical protein